MEDNDRFEPVTEKESVFSKIGKYFKNVFGSFIDSFKYNNMKLASILVALPGLIIGFFITVHANTISQIGFEFQVKKIIDAGTSTEKVIMDTAQFPGMPFDATAIAVFVLMLFGILNIFNALSMSGKKNKGSVIVATIFTSVLVLVTAYYVYCIMYYKKITSDGIWIGTVTGKKTGEEFAINKVYTLQNDKLGDFNNNYLTSTICEVIF